MKINKVTSCHRDMDVDMEIDYATFDFAGKDGILSLFISEFSIFSSKE